MQVCYTPALIAMLSSEQHPLAARSGVVPAGPAGDTLPSAGMSSMTCGTPRWTERTDHGTVRYVTLMPWSQSWSELGSTVVHGAVEKHAKLRIVPGRSSDRRSATHS